MEDFQIFEYHWFDPIVSAQFDDGLQCYNESSHEQAFQLEILTVLKLLNVSISATEDSIHCLKSFIGIQTKNIYEAPKQFEKKTDICSR